MRTRRARSYKPLINAPGKQIRLASASRGTVDALGAKGFVNVRRSPSRDARFRRNRSMTCHRRRGSPDRTPYDDVMTPGGGSGRVPTRSARDASSSSPASDLGGTTSRARRRRFLHLPPLTRTMRLDARQVVAPKTLPTLAPLPALHPDVPGYAAVRMGGWCEDAKMRSWRRC